MTLEEAIKHCEEVAEENQKQADDNVQFEQDGIKHIYDAEEYDKCLECSEEHRQLAEWLTELKFYKMAFGKIEERLLGIVCYKGRIFKLFDDDLVLKTQDKNGMCSFYGFREVGETE